MTFVTWGNAPAPYTEFLIFKIIWSPSTIADLRLEIGHASRPEAQDDYLADVRKPGEANKAVADADFAPQPKVIKDGTDGD
jgi:hypothetical protein